MIFMNFIKLFFILVFSLSLVASTDILKDSQVYIDKENKYTIKNIDQADFESFQKYAYPYSKDISKIHRGYTDEIVWIKFSIINETDQVLKKVLVLDNQMLDHIVLFEKKDEGYTKETKGVLHDVEFAENILDFYFDIKLQPNEKKEYYLQVSSTSCAVYFNLQLMDKDILYKNEMSHQLSLCLFFGAMLALVFYNLFIYFFTKDNAYIYYVCYIFFTVWNHISYTGMGAYFQPKWFYDLDTFLTIHYLSFISIFSLLFTRDFLNIKKYKKINFIFKVFIFIAIFLMVVSSEEFYPMDLTTFLLFLSFIFMISSSYYLYFTQKEENTKYILMGWSIAIFGWMMLATEQYGFWSILYEYPYFYEFSIFIEAVLFSIALSAKLNKTKELELAVNKSAILTKELHHRVKNNMQFIISLYRLKLSKYMDQKLSYTLNEIELAIQAMSATHEMLYEKDDLEHIDTKEYIGELIDRISKSFDLKEIKTNLDIDIELNINESITLGIILNELITNSLKYAFVTKGQIDIFLKQKEGIYTLVYKDDGKGFDIQSSNNTFGLRLIKNLVKDELKGTLEIKSSQGSIFTIPKS